MSIYFKKEETVRTFLLSFLFFSLIVLSIIYNSDYVSDNKSLGFILAYIRLFFAFVCFLLSSDKVFNSFRNIFLVLIPLILLFLSFRVINFNEMIFAFLVFPAVNVLGINRMLRIDLFARTFSFFVVILFFRILKTSTFFYGSGRMKPSLGFSNPNTLGEIALVIACELFILRKEINKFVFYGLDIFIFIIIFISGSRTTIYMYILFILLQIFMENTTFFKKNTTAKRLVISGLPFYLFMISIYVVYRYTYFANNFLIKIDYILSGRLRYTSYYFSEYKLNAFPTNIGLTNASKIGPLDPGYISLLERDGLIICCIFLLYLSITIFKLCDNKYRKYISSFIIFIFIGLSESTFYVLSINIFLLYLAVILKNSENENRRTISSRSKLE